ncbi:hypothetical protein N7532_008320 [Penicillium argentinense]|uniref:Uncharacterized protein n=1 Tax=Penicillium argentinense TaxID=1131581 RepID=A0A9W9EXF9_9EURO|nr:uncharacterized protein N7532_008320 [Penicillium argentinense]KAJ5089636.1 hypothetical protein N7532_008320 [Penicillium argentinense]
MRANTLGHAGGDGPSVAPGKLTLGPHLLPCAPPAGVSLSVRTICPKRSTPRLSPGASDGLGEITPYPHSAHPGTLGIGMLGDLGLGLGLVASIASSPFPRCHGRPACDLPQKPRNQILGPNPSKPTKQRPEEYQDRPEPDTGIPQLQLLRSSRVRGGGGGG